MTMTMNDAIAIETLVAVIAILGGTAWLRFHRYRDPFYTSKGNTMTRERGPNMPKRTEPYDATELELIRADITFLKAEEEANGNAAKWREAQEGANRHIFSRNHGSIV
jgi:hypothetical protein